MINESGIVALKIYLFIPEVIVIPKMRSDEGPSTTMLARILKKVGCKFIKNCMGMVRLKIKK